MDNGQLFDEHRDRLRLTAYRLLGSPAEAEDAVQETWLRLASTDRDGIDNLPGWLTTVVSRICLDLLRARRARREDLVGQEIPDRAAPASNGDPEAEAVLLDSVGRAVLVVLDRLTPDERIAFVLHDMFAVPFDRIAPIVERSTATTKKLASRARGKVRGSSPVSSAELTRRRRVVEAFLAASRAGDIEALLEILSPDVVRRADRFAIASDRPAEVRGARTVAQEIATFGRHARFAVPVLVDGSIGIAIAPHGRLLRVQTLEFDGDRITAYELLAEPARLEQLELALLPGQAALSGGDVAPRRANRPAPVLE